MILVLAVLCVAGAVFAAGEVATYAARLKAKSIRRARDYGRARLPEAEADLVRFRERVLVPLVARLAAVPLKLSPKTNVDAIGPRLVAAGLNQRLTVGGFLAIKGGAIVGGATLGFALGAAGSPAMIFVLAPFFGVLGLIAPEWILTMKIRNRRESIRGDLPDALDLLAVSVEAGLGFDAAMGKVIEHVDEFALMLNEIRVGEARQVALRKLAERVGAPELSNFVRAVIQADQLGISLGRILRVQAADTRHRRQAAAEEKAMKAPIKMLFPTVVLIFPAMFIVILGPALLNILKVFHS